MDIPIPLVGPSNEGIHRKADSQRSINLYPHKIEREGEKARWILQGAPGFTEFAELPYRPIRGRIVTSTGRNFWVVNAYVYEVYSDGTFYQWGTIGTVGGRVTMAELAGIITIGDGSGFYALDTTAATITAITDAPRGRHCFAFRQRMHYVESGNTVAPGQVFYSEVLDPTNVSEFYTAENKPDGLLSGLATEDRICLLGTDSIEFRYDAGGTTPFQVVPGGVVHSGLYAEHTALVADNTIFYVERDTHGQGIVRRFNGFTPVRISTEAVERFTESATFLTAFTYQEQGHIFYGLNADEGTWVFDIKENEWHERPWKNPANGQLERGRPEIHAFAFGKHLVSDWETGQIFEQNLSLYAHDTEPMVSRRIFRFPDFGGRNVTADQVWFDFAVGVGLTTGQGSDPTAMIRYSVDGGMTWSNELHRSLGEIGKYMTRLQVNRLGSGRDWAIEVSISDPVPRVMVGATARVRVGR